MNTKSLWALAKKISRVAYLSGLEKGRKEGWEHAGRVEDRLIAAIDQLQLKEKMLDDAIRWSIVVRDCQPFMMIPENAMPPVDTRQELQIKVKVNRCVALGMPGVLYEEQLAREIARELIREIRK